jgi:dipeptidyl-peptidase-3
MKKFLTLIMMTSIIASCTQEQTESDFRWVIDRFDDVKVIRYQVPEFDALPLEQKMLVYYLGEAAKCGRDIMFDQNFKYNLAIRRTLEGIYTNYMGDPNHEEWQKVVKYLKKVWFANGIHHHYSMDKFQPEFSQEYFEQLVAATPDEALPLDFGTREELMAAIVPAMFDSSLYARRLDQSEGVDMITASANNYYDGVTQKEVEKFYADMIDPTDPQPISYGLNSQLTKDENGKVVERVWKLGGMYGEAIEKIVYWLDKAAEVANPTQKEIIVALRDYYCSGNLRDFDKYNVLWVKDVESNIDFVNGFIEDYGDPMGRKASWESNVSLRSDEATKRTELISANAQWFEDNSPVNPAFRKPEVKGVSAKVINVAMLGGDCYPATPIGINLPNADWIRRDYGSKSVTIDNITYAYKQAAKGNGFNEEFILREEDRARIEEFGALGDNLHTDLHECLGHGSGQLAPGTKGGELKNYGSTLEETRADLFGLYYLGDEKLVELGLIPSLDVAKAQYASYIVNGMMTQYSRIELGKDVEEAHMRNRKLIAEWCYEKGKADNVIEWVEQDGKRYLVVNDFDKLRELFGQMLYEVQRIKSEGDFEAGKALVENYAVKIDLDLHKEVLERYNALNIEPFGGFINPELVPVMDGDKIVDVKVEYVDSYTDQMLNYSKNYSFLPTRN